jgi:hypothetical protein
MPLLPHPRDIVVVHEATSEFEAIAIRDILEGAGIRAMIRSRLLPAYEILLPGMLEPGAGVYADILVLTQHEEEARRVIAEYLNALRTQPAEESSP